MGLFAIVNEKTGKPYYYTMCENDINSFTKDFDTTFSFIYHYLTTILKKTKKLIVYMDNCPGTNKNNYMF